MRRLSALQRDIVRVVAGNEEPTGIEVVRELEDYYEKDVNPSTVYENLYELRDRGYVHSRRLAAFEQSPKVYTLTTYALTELMARDEWNNVATEEDVLAYDGEATRARTVS